MMSEGHCVIIGNGPAANEAAATLREKAPHLRVTLVGQEPTGYFKPHLLPDYIAGVIPEESVYATPLEFYKEKGIALRLGQRAVDVDFTARRVVLEHKEVVPFDGLIIAVGGQPHVPQQLARFAHLMLTLKTVADAKRWIARLSRAESVLIVGGDLPSFAFAKAMLHLGKEVSFILSDHSLWPMACTEEIRQQVFQALTARGVKVLESKRINSMAVGSDYMVEVQTDRGTVKAGVVGAFFGLAPDVQFLRRTGLDIERGILVDECLQTRFPNVYAAGDCAQVYHPSLRDYWVSVGYGNAMALGRIAALNLAGNVIPVDVQPESIFRVDGITVNVSWWMEF